MSATTRPPSPSLASLSGASESDVETLSSADALSVARDNAPAPTGEDATADGKQGSRFFEGEGLVTFLVEGTSYRVHEYLLTMHSSYWARELGSKKETGGQIELEGVTVHDMDALMKILYHKSFQGYDLTELEEWSSVLRMATKWECKSVRGLAIERLGSLASPPEKLALARAFGVADWLQPALVALCVRKEPLTLAEAEGNQLSMEDVITINTIREATRQKTQVVADESKVSAHTATYITRTETILSDAQTLTTPEIAKVADTIASPSSSSTSCLPIVFISTSASTPPAVKPFLLSATPSSEDMDYLVTVLLKPDFNLAVSMVTSDNVGVFADALKDFTNVYTTRLLSENLVDAIIRRSAEDILFIPIGIQLLRALPESMRFSVSWTPELRPLKSFFYQRAMDSTKVHRSIMSIRTRYNDMRLSLRHVTVDMATEKAKHLSCLGIMCEDTPTTSLYDERSANLQTLYNQLVGANMLDQKALA